MARAESGRAGGSRRGRVQRRPPTWEISDSDSEGPAGVEAAVRVPDSADERRAAAETPRRLRPDQALRRLTVLVDPAILEDAGADILMEALDTLGCEYRVEPQRPARSLRWSRVKPDPCPYGVPPEVWAADEQDLLLLLEPEEFLQGVIQLTQIRGPACSVPWITPGSPACPHLAVIGLDAYLWSHQPSTRETRLPESSAMACAQVAVGWPEVEEALVLLQLWANVDVLLVASWQELSQHVCTFTKALAQRPFKCAGPGVGALFLLHCRALGSRRASSKRWHRAAGGLVAADPAVQPGQPSCGRCCCHRLPLPPPSATGAPSPPVPGMEGPQDLPCSSLCLP
ncbi:probable crossover junction endonuclease EME2 isoform X3 [Vicugna pacos]|uniref:Probable crossover junction endonuclease EME2 isoform X3 n=1 Tax=Vicugna pacos TaxID=30538 RepID=A0ABM5BQ25_VICPA